MFEFSSPYIIPIVGLVIFWGGPLLFFQKKLRRLFSRHAVVGFYNDHLSIATTINQSDRSSKVLEEEYYFKDLLGIRLFNSAKDDSSEMKLYFRGGRKKRYNFLGQNVENAEDNITDIIAHYIISYNKCNDEAGRVKYIPNLFASRHGTVYMVLLSSLLTVILIFQIIAEPKTLPFTFFAGIFLYFQIIMQRKRDIKDMKKFNGD
jgi:hypothetical protein